MKDMLKTLEEHGRWKAYKEYKGRQEGLAGYGSTKVKALADFEEQESAVRNQKEFTSRW